MAKRDGGQHEKKPKKWGGAGQLNTIGPSAGLSLFWVLGAENLRDPLALADQNLQPENLVKSSLSGPLGAHTKPPMDKPAQIGPRFNE
ncbi:hypothetical protein TNCV_2160551 [Trichonephila clavipes]|nr:hypothetical protein TNCV_2160551 [Trichonephila clavipes]